MFPQAILFDLDDTLFDHRRSSDIALRVVHDRYAGEVDFASFSRKHAEVLELYHHRFLKGELNLDQARAGRMQALFAHFGMAVNGEQAHEIGMAYRHSHLADRALVPGARALLEALQGRATLGIVSNNSTVEQFAKLRTLGIAHYFEAIVISEDVGVAKPDRRIFDIALERLGARAHETVMIGDSLHADIAGAAAAGLATVWLNRDTETQASTRLSRQKWLESRADAGLCHLEIRDLQPAGAVLRTIAEAFKQNTLGLKEAHYAKLETLAT
jgi:putative hydrolase of the HAD superfamily